MNAVDVLASLLISAGIVSGYRYVSTRIREINHLNQLAKDLESHLEEAFKKAVIPVIAERHNGDILLYNAVTQQFLCQGRDRQELEEKIHSQFPKKILVLDERSDPDVLAAFGT